MIPQPVFLLPSKVWIRVNEYTRLPLQLELISRGRYFLRAAPGKAY